MYEYAARAIEVHDGDTVKLEVDLGLRTYHRAWFRLAHVNAPELHQADGARARDRLAELIVDDGPGFPLIVRTTRDRTEKYGRWLATITSLNGRDVGEVLLTEGLVKPYEGGRR